MAGAQPEARDERTGPGRFSAWLGLAGSFWGQAGVYVLAVHLQFGILILGPVFGRFSAELGPNTPLERRGSPCSAGCTKNQPTRTILRQFRGNSEF